MIITTPYRFTPARLSECQLYVTTKQPNTIVTSTGSVESWKDLSGKGNDLSASGTDRPTYDSSGIRFGHVGVDFDKSMLSTSSALLSSGSFSVFTVVQGIDVSSSTRAICAQLSGTAHADETGLQYLDTSGKFGFYRASAFVGSYPLQNHSAYILETRYDVSTDTVTLFINGLEVGSDSYTNLSFESTNFTIGGVSSGMSHFRGQIGACIVYADYLTDTQAGFVRQFLGREFEIPLVDELLYGQAGEPNILISCEKVGLIDVPIWVRRSSDNAEVGVYAKLGETITSSSETTDGSTLGTWASTDDIYIKEIYDAALNVYTFSQATAADQPELDLTGMNNKAAPYFNVSRLTTSTTIDFQINETLIVVNQLTSGSRGCMMGNYSNSPNINYEYHSSSGNYRYYYNNGQVESFTNTTNLANANHIFNVSRDTSATETSLYLDNSLDATNLDIGTGITGLTQFSIGADRRNASVSGSIPLHGYITLIMLWDTTQSSANRNTAAQYASDMYGISI